MPRWPGLVMTLAGAVLAIGALSVASLVVSGRLDMSDPEVLVWASLLGAALFAAGLVYTAVRQIRVRSFLPPERYRGPAALLLLALVLVVATVINAPFSSDIAALVGGEGELTLLGAAVILMSTQVALLLVSWLFVARPNALAGLPAFPGRDAARSVREGLVWGVAAWVLATALGALMVLVLEAVGIDPEPQTAEQAVNMLEPWIVVPAVVIVAPIAEEVFFRGVVFNAWLREGGRRWAFIGSSALFAIIHLSLVSIVPIFVLGLALAWVYDRTGSLLAPIVMHAVVNGISVALALLVRFDVLQLPV
jgi:membrane protease YdiL (CAAX protease family)